MEKILPSVHQPVLIIVNPASSDEYAIRAVFDSETLNGGLKLRLMDDFNSALLKTGLSVVLEFTRADALYQLGALLTGVEHEKALTFVNELPFGFFTPNHPAKRVQRRHYYRLPVKLSVRFKPVTLPDGYEKSREIRRKAQASWQGNRHPMVIGTTFDLSGGGLAMTSPVALDKNEALYLEFSLPEMSFKLAAKIIIIKPNRKHDEQSCIVGVHFFSIEAVDQDQLLQYIFREQKK
jgi:hypothetical protein